MAHEVFIELQVNHQKSGLPLELYLQQIGINFTTYNYWRKKLLAKDNPKQELAPISFIQHVNPVFSSSVHAGATHLFPNGLRAHFSSGTESVLLELLNKSRNDL